MFDEDGRKITIQEFPRNLEALSVEDLALYIEDLNAEIRKCEAEMARKKASAEAAANVFKS